MRTEQEMYSLILDFAQSDQRIRLVGMEGSRTNIHIPRDSFQDYDISFLVTDMDSFRRDDGWLDALRPAASAAKTRGHGAVSAGAGQLVLLPDAV